MSTAQVQAFWDNQAVIHSTDDHATAPDHHYRSLEIKSIISHLGRTGQVLDVGCGNGYSTIKFAQAKPEAQFLGMDYSQKMYEAAIKAKDDLKIINAGFVHKDVRDFNFSGEFDCIITERCLINLDSWEEQKDAIARLAKHTKKLGKLIIVENTLEGLAALNDQRHKFGLPTIKQRWHNRYISRNSFLEYVPKCGLHIEAEQNIGSLYYLISRVLYAKMAQDAGEEPKYDHVINEIAAQLPLTPNYHYSPNVLWVLRKS